MRPGRYHQDVEYDATPMRRNNMQVHYLMEQGNGFIIRRRKISKWIIDPLCVVLTIPFVGLYYSIVLGRFVITWIKKK